jgi:type II secretory pathway component PulF
MLLSSELPLPSLIQFCRALRHSLGAGLGIVTVFRQQSERGDFRIRPVAGRIGEELEKGESLESALKQERGHFPAMFVSMTIVGEQSGNLPEILAELEKYFALQLKLRREFRQQIAWPVIQFVLAGLVIPTMIVFLSILSQGGKPFDPLGFGLTGGGGAITFMFFFYGTPILMIAAYVLLTRNLNRAARVHALLLRLWVIGPCLRALALMRFCLALRLTMETGMSIKRALRLSLNATGNAAFEAQADIVEDAIRGGEELSLALSRAGVFPPEFLDILANAEESGRLVEVMDNQAKFYEEEASLKMKILSRAAAWGVYALIAATIIFMIFRIAMSIYGPGGAVDPARYGL